jgi:hypothetical protein
LNFDSLVIAVKSGFVNPESNTTQSLSGEFRLIFHHNFSLNNLNSPCLLTLQPWMGLGILHGFVTVIFSGVGSLSACLALQPREPGTTLSLVSTL